MIAVGVIALILGSVGPGRRWYRRWTYHRAQAAVYARLERTERANHARERQASSDRELIRRGLIRTPGIAGKSPRDIDRAVDRAVAYHHSRAEEALAAAGGWAEKRRDCETAALWCWDPFAPDVP
jgi:hypothetical protein